MTTNVYILLHSTLRNINDTPSCQLRCCLERADAKATHPVFGSPQVCPSHQAWSSDPARLDGTIGVCPTSAKVSRHGQTCLCTV